MNIIKKGNALMLCIFLIPILLMGQSPSKQQNIAIIADANQPYLNDILSLIIKECNDLLRNQYRLVFRDENRRYANWDENVIKSDLQEFLKADDIDMIIGIGALSSAELAKSGPYEKPVFATVVLSAELQGIQVTEEANSGMRNMTYVVAPYDHYKDIRTFHSLHPFKHLTILLDKYFFDQITGDDAEFESLMADLGATTSLIPVDLKAADVLEQLSETSDAVYVGPIVKMSNSEIQLLIDGINEKKIPSFAFIGKPGVERGIMAGLAPASNFSRMARRLALNIEAYLEGKKLKNMPVYLKYQEQPVINLATVQDINFNPTWEFLEDAEILNDALIVASRKISLIQTVNEALDNNNELAIAKKDVEAGQYDVRESKSPLLPQLDVSATTSIIDQDRAAVSNGQAPERSTTASSSVSQIIFSEGANSNYAVAKRQQEALVKSFDATEMDIILTAVETYLNLMQAKALERIQKENIKLNRANLKLAEVRQEVGDSGPSDLLRWKSSIALANIDLNNAFVNRKAAEIALNTLLNRPIGELFETSEVDITDSHLALFDNRVLDLIDSPYDLTVFTDFLVKEGFANLPEVKQINANIAAQDRFLTFTRRNFYLPEIGFSANTSYLLNRAGAGSEIIAQPGIERPNDLTWQLGISASLPLYTGNRRNAQNQKAVIGLEQLQFQKKDLLNQLEQRIRVAVTQVSASYANIGLSEEAEDAAKRNFEIFQDAYAEGTVSVIELIDAQNSAIQASLNAANAGYQFLIDFFNVERAIGKYYSLGTVEDREDFFRNYQTYIENIQN